MTKTENSITNVFAMGKGTTENYTANGGTDDYVFLKNALYKVPLNPLLTRGTLSDDMIDFNADSVSAVSNATAITSYEIHLADDGTTLTNAIRGINQSNSSTQTYSSVNRIYPNSTTIDDHLSNLETTKGHVLKTYDYLSDTGQRLITERTTLSGNETSTDTTVAVASASNLAVNDVIIVNNEEMLITGISGTDLTVERGYNNTTATAHLSGDLVYEKDLLDDLWVLVYSDDPNTHHFAKITEILEHDVYGDAIEFSPSLGADIPKDTKFAVFKGGTIKANDTLVACAYGLQSDGSNNRHYLNTHVSKPFFYFTNGKDRLEPATRYILRTSSWNGSTHTYTYSTFLTEQAYNGVIVDSGPFTMEATLVDMMYKADDPAAVKYIAYTSDNLVLVNGAPDTITVSSDASFDNSITDLDTYSDTNWSATGILKNSRFSILGSSANNFTFTTSADSTATTLTLENSDLTGSSDFGNTLQINIPASSVDLDHNKLYTIMDATEDSNSGNLAMIHAFRMAHRPDTESATTFYQHNMGQSRYAFYTDSPLTNTIIPNAMEMIDYEGVSATGGYVDIVFADTQKILAKKIQQNDSITIHQVIDEQEVGSGRNIVLPGTFEYNSAGTTITVNDLNEGEDLRYLLEAAIPNTRTETSGQTYALYEAFTVMTSEGPYHFVPDLISAPSGNSQTITIREWRKYSDALYTLTTTTSPATNVPVFSANAYRKTWSFVADNVMLPNVPIDSKLDKTYAQIRDFEDTVTTNLTDTTVNEFKVGETVLEKASESRIHDINLILRGGQQTGFRTNVDFGDSRNKFVKLKNPLLFDKKMNNLGKEPIDSESELGYDMDTTIAKVAKRNLSNVSFYGPNVNPKTDGGGSEYRYDLNSADTDSNNHVRGTTSYLDYFTGAFNVEKKVFSGVVDSIEQVVEDGMFKLKVRGRDNTAELLGPIINQTFKFTEDIVYSTVGPFERMALYGTINHGTNTNVYEVGTTQIIISRNSNSLTDGAVGDLLFTTQGVFIGRIYTITEGSSDEFTITFEEGIPTRLKDDETIMISSQFASLLSNIEVKDIDDMSEIAKLKRQFIRGNTVSFAKAMSANPYNTTRVNSLLGAGSKGVIFTGGNSLSLSSKNAPSKEGNTLIGTSSSSHPQAKGYSIHAPDKIDYDLPFYCHLADEITDKYTVDYSNLHTVNSLTEYDIVNISTKDQETVIEIAPICPAVLARIDDNPLDGRDKTLVSMGNFPDATAILGSDSIPNGYQGIFNYTSGWIEELNEGDFIFDSSGNLFGRIIDISSSGATSNGTCFTLDRPLFKEVTSSEGIYKYYSAASPAQYYSGTDIVFDSNNGTSNFGGTNYLVSILTSSGSTGVAFLKTLEAGMRIKIEGHADKDNNGVFSIGHVFEEDTDVVTIIFSRKQSNGNIAAAGYDNFNDDGAGDSIRITVLTDYFTQGLYFLNTQGLSQGGVLTLTNPILSSPNAVDDVCKPIKWASGLYHYITDNSVASKASTVYNPNSSEHTIFSDVIDRYGNTKWRYFGLQRGMSLSYINRGRKDGLIKDAYTFEKGRVNGYAAAYRVSDAKYGNNNLMKFPYGYHNNDFSWSVQLYDDNANAYVELFPSTNLIKNHPYFLEYPSPESRDFRPVMGSNFADFNRHGTTVVADSEHADYRVLQYPRYMPRLHDNHRGGDWQEDMEAITNTLDPTVIYQKFTADGASTANANDYAIDVDTSTTPDEWFINPTADDDTHFSSSLAGRWVKLGGHADKNKNRVFKLKDSFEDVSSGNGRLLIENDELPFTTFGADSTNAQTTVDDQITSATSSSGYEQITVLYPPWIGPKFDGITRAKDHWELPDPKTLRWFIFSLADLYPDSMSRKHHIGYSGTIDGTATNRAFTDYNLLLKDTSSFGNSSTFHEYYEGSLLEENEIDDQYETLPISEASITPSEMKRFGLMRLIDCTYDWHFNLIDPERLPSDMSKLNTPNFEYTRYQPLRRRNLLISGYGSSDTVLTVNNNPSTLLEIGDQIFTDKGFYLGKVKENNTSSTSFTLVGSALKPILKADGTRANYYGYVYVCGDGETLLAAQDRHDSFYQFMTKGRDGKNTFTEVSTQSKLNMLQGMWAGHYMQYVHSITDTEFSHIPYGVIDGASGANGTAVADGDYALTTVGAADTNHDVNFTTNKFLNHFNENYSIFQGNSTYPGQNQYISPLITLPPAFRTYYSTSTTTTNTDRTVNVLQGKTYLLSKIGSGTNPIQTEYSHVSNILEWHQLGGNPYWRCALVALGNYSVENSTGLRIPVGGKTKAAAHHNSAVNNFAHSKPSISTATGASYNNGTTITHTGHTEVLPAVGMGVSGDGIPQDSYIVSITDANNFVISQTTTGGSKSGETVILTTTKLSDIKYGDGIGALTSTYGSFTSGEYSMMTLKGNQHYWGLAAFRHDESTVIANSDDNNYIACGVYNAFIPNLYLSPIKNTVIGDGTVGETNEGVITFSSINGNTNQGWLRIEMQVDGDDNYNPFLNFVDLTGMYLVGNIGYEVGFKTLSNEFAPFNGNDYDVSGILRHSTSASKQINYDVGFTSMSDAVIDPKHIMYVHEHRRNSTGKVVAHELLIDNIPYDNTGAVEFFDNYRIMRPAETCLWPESPNEININTLSAQTTKMPQNNRMYDYVPSLLRVNSSQEFMGPDFSDPTSLVNQGVAGENEAVMSMYVAIDMDARHSQYKDLTGTVSINIGESVVTGSGTAFTTELQEGDVIKLDHQYCYVKTITSDTSLIIENKFANDTNLSGSSAAYLFNNTFTVVRDYVHLFNPTGNRNTFKDGSSYNMLLTDGVSKQKLSMAVQAKYWDDIAKCSISLSDRIKEPMYGIVSFGEIFTLKSNVPTTLTDVSSARIGSTVTIGSEVEDIVNDLLANENTPYDISDNREYPYYIAPNFQGVDLYNAVNFAAKYKDKEVRVDEKGLFLRKQTRDLDLQDITLSYDNTNLNIIEVSRNKSTFDLYNEVIVYGSGVRSIRRDRASIEKFKKKTLEDVNMELTTQDDVDKRAISLLRAHSQGDDRFTIKMGKAGIEFVKAGDIITLDLPEEGITKGQYKIYEIRRELAGLIELEVGTYRKDLAARFAELAIQNKSNTASIRGSNFLTTVPPLDFFDKVKLKELRLTIKRTGLADATAFTLGFQTLEARKLDFGTTMGPADVVTEIIRDVDLT